MRRRRVRAATKHTKHTHSGQPTSRASLLRHELVSFPTTSTTLLLNLFPQNTPKTSPTTPNTPYPSPTDVQHDPSKRLAALALARAPSAAAQCAALALLANSTWSDERVWKETQVRDVVNALMGVLFASPPNVGRIIRPLNRCITRLTQASPIAREEARSLIISAFDSLEPVPIDADAIDEQHWNIAASLLNLTPFPHVLQVLEDYPQTVNNLVRFITSLVKFLLAQGMTTATTTTTTTATDEDDAQSLVSGSFLVTSQQLQKTFISFSTLQQACQPAFERCFQATEDDSPAAQLCAVVCQVLVTPSLHRDCFTRATLTLTALLCASAKGDMALLSRVLLFTVTHPTPGAPFPEDVLAVPVVRWVHADEELLAHPGAGGLFAAMSDTAQLGLLRSITTHVPSEALFDTSSSDLPSGLLFGPIFAHLSGLCEHQSPHTRMYAFQSLMAWLSQLSRMAQKALKKQDATLDQLCALKPAMDACLDRTRELITPNWEHPFRPMLNVMRGAYDAYLDCVGHSAHLAPGDVDMDAVWDPAVLPLIHDDGFNRSRMFPLESLLGRLSPTRVLRLRPDFIGSLLLASENADAWKVGTTLLHKFLVALYEELGLEASMTLGDDHPSLQVDDGKNKRRSSKKNKKKKKSKKQKQELTPEQVTMQLAVARSAWIEPFVRCAIRGTTPRIVSERLCNNFAQYIMRQIDRGSVKPILETLSAYEDRIDNHSVYLFTMLSVVATARRNNAISDALLREYAPPSVLQRALLHAEPKLRMLGLVFMSSHSKVTELFADDELRVLRYTLPYLMKVVSTTMRSQTVHQVTRILQRIKTSTERWVNQNQDAVASAPELPAEIRPSVLFVRWMNDMLVRSMCPGTPFERLCSAVELYRFVVTTWASGKADDSPGLDQFWGIRETVHTREVVLVLANNLVNSWDRIRIVVVDILSTFASHQPLPGFETLEHLRPLIRWAVRLVRAPRVRDSDAGALSLRCVFVKYVLDLKWKIPLHTIALEASDDNTTELPDATSAPAGVAESAEEAALHFFRELVRIIQTQAAAMSSQPVTLRYNSDQGRVHGMLLFFRYLLSFVPWKEWFEASALLDDWRQLFADVIETFKHVADVSLQLHVQAHAQAPRAKTGSVLDFLPETSVEDGGIAVDCRGHAITDGNEADSPEEQLRVVSSWLAVKELCLALGHMAEVLPIGDDDAAMLQIGQLASVGQLFLTILLSTKHRGVIDKAHCGFVVLSEALLSSGCRPLVDLVAGWLDGLITSISTPSRSMHWIRRSAGLPYCFLSLLQAEPTHTEPVLIPFAMQKLLELAEAGQDDESGDEEDAGLWQSRVHTLNVLRALFLDSALSTDTAHFAGQAMIVALKGFSHPQWAVRNSSLLTYTAVLQRTMPSEFSESRQPFGNSGEELALALKSVRTRGSATTGASYFTLYPTLRPYLVSLLQPMLGAEDARGQMHPAMYPILLLLSRLTPAQSESIDDPIGVYSFLPFVSACARHANSMARFMAAKATVGLVPVDHVAEFIDSAIAALPDDGAVDYNAAEGSLMQVQKLLLHHFPYCSVAPAPFSPSRVLKALLAKRWLATARNPCAPVRRQFCEVVQLLVSPETQQYLDGGLAEERRVVLGLALACLAPLEAAGVVDGDALRSVAGQLCWDVLSSAAVAGDAWLGSLDVTRLVLQLLEDESSTVRQSVLSKLQQAVEVQVDTTSSTAQASAALFAHINSSQLADKLLAVVLADDLMDMDPALVTLVLGTLVSLSEDSWAPTDELWTTLMACVREHGNTELCVEGGRLLASAWRRLHSVAPETLEAKASEFLDWLVEASEYEAPQPLRMMTGDALRISRLHMTDEPVSAALQLRTWSVLARMLQDEAQGVRDMAGEIVAAHIPTHGQQPYGAELHSWLDGEKHKEGMAWGECASLELLLAMVYARFQDSAPAQLAEFLLELLSEHTDVAVAQETEDEDATPMPGSRAFQADLQVRLWEKEQANNIFEPAIVIELAGFYLARLFSWRAVDSQPLRELVAKQRTSSLVALNHALDALVHARDQQDSGWMGGPSYWYDVFSVAYARSALVIAVLQCHQELLDRPWAGDAQLAQLLDKLAAVLGDAHGGVHPLLTRVLQHVHRLAQRVHGGEASPSEGRDPVPFGFVTALHSNHPGKW